MHGPTCIFWAKLTLFWLQARKSQEPVEDRPGIYKAGGGGIRRLGRTNEEILMDQPLCADMDVAGVQGDPRVTGKRRQRRCLYCLHHPDPGRAQKSTVHSFCMTCDTPLHPHCMKVPPPRASSEKGVRLA